MAINKATLAKEIDGVIEYIYPKTSGDIVVYDDTRSVSAMISMLVNNKVDKEDGKGLSSNDFTTALKNRLEGLQRMLNAWDNGNLNFQPTCPRDLYTVQESAMRTYLDVLKRRAAIENVELDN